MVSILPVPQIVGHGTPPLAEAPARHVWRTCGSCGISELVASVNPHTELQRTPLHAAHERLGARLTPFAGWSMPVQYAGIIAEHRAVRTAAGLFDVSHMGELECTGAAAAACVARLTCAPVERLEVGQARYSMILNETGGIIDDVIVYRLGDAWYRIVINAANAAAVADHAGTVAAGIAGAELRDAGAELGLLAVQGPRAVALVQDAAAGEVASLGRYRCRRAEVAGIPALVARTGYTGEDGFELFVAAEQAEPLWTRLLEAGAPAGLVPAGLGARDTLRLEAALPLYGNELGPEVSPLEVGLGRFVAKSDTYVGAAAIRRLRAAGAPGMEHALVHLQLHGRAVARAGYPIATPAGTPAGSVTSGGYGPWLERSLAMGLVARHHAAVGGELAVVIRGRPHAATVVKRPFYQREDG